MPGPDLAASSSVAWPISAAVGITPSAAAKKTSGGRGVGELEHDGRGDEDAEQVDGAHGAADY